MEEDKPKTEQQQPIANTSTETKESSTTNPTTTEPPAQTEKKLECPKEPSQKGFGEKCKGCPRQALCQKNAQSLQSCPKDQSQKGFADKCKGCPMQAQCQRNAQSADAIPKEIAEKLKNIKNIIIVLSGKGGVGKSTVSSQIALGLSKKENLQIGLLDIDICGPSIPRMMGLEKEEVRQSPEGMAPVYKESNLAIMSIGFLLNDNRSAVIWRGPRKNGMIKEFLCNVAWDHLDYLIIDTPPGTSDEHLTLVQYLKYANVKGSIIVTTPQEVSLLDVRKEVNFCKKTDVKILGVVENMAYFVCPHCDKKTEIFEANTGGGASLCKEFDLSFLARLPLEPKILQSTETGKYFPDTCPDSVTAKEINNLVNSIINC